MKLISAFLCLISILQASHDPLLTLILNHVRVYQSLSNVYQYYVNNLENFNFDGIFGVIATSDVLHDLCHLDYTFEFISTDVFTKICHLSEAFYVLRHEKIPEILNKIDDQELHFIRNLDWHMHYTSSNMYRNYTLTNTPEDFNEDFTDFCIKQVYKHRRDCHFDKACMRFLLHGGLNSYIVTHQLLFLDTIYRSKCRLKFQKTLEKIYFLDYATLFDQYCSIIIDEAKHLIKEDPDPFYWDLISEQISLCTLVGFHEGLKLEFLDRVLSFQLKEGCFSMELQNEPEIPTERKVLKDHYHSDGCSSHNTAVATLALTVYLYKPSVEFNRPQDIAKIKTILNGISIEDNGLIPEPSLLHTYRIYLFLIGFLMFCFYAKRRRLWTHRRY